MALGCSPGVFPRMLTLLAAGGGLFVGFFSFVFGCVLENRLPSIGGTSIIMLAMVLCVCGLVLLLAALNVIRIFQVNIHLTASITIFGIVISFIQMVMYCRYAKAFHILAHYSIYESYFAVSIVLILLLFGIMVAYALLVAILMKHHATTTTTVTSTTRTTTTTIETPPSYMGETSSQVTK